MRATWDRKFIKKQCNRQEEQGGIEREWDQVSLKGRHNEEGHRSCAAYRGETRDGSLLL